MKFIIDLTTDHTLFAKIDLLLFPVLPSKNGKNGIFDKALMRFDGIDQKLIQKTLDGIDIKSGATKLIRLNSKPAAVFIAKIDALTERKLMLLVRQFVRTGKAEGFKNLGIYCDDFESIGVSSAKAMSIIVEQSLVAHFDFSEKFKTSPEDGWKFVETIHLILGKKQKSISGVIAQGEILGNAINACRMLSAYPPGEMTPIGLAEYAKELEKNSKKLIVTIFDETKMKSEGMNAILTVGKGSSNPPRLIIMEYRGGKAADQPLAFVGKGVTFDSGGLNLKPGEGMTDMHMDMSGGAAVILAMDVISKLALPINIIGIVPAAENMPSGFSYRQGDIIKAYGGKTIEVGNTDAEGRVIMADAIEYMKTKKPALLVSIATLTSHSIVALGMRASALFVKNNKNLQDAIQEIGEITGDRVWPLPLWDEHDKEVEGNQADVTNTNKIGTRYGWAIHAAAFLWQFAKPMQFAHIDMAPRMITIEDDFLAKGASGFGVKLLTELAKKWSAVKKDL